MAYVNCVFPDCRVIIATITLIKIIITAIYMLADAPRGAQLQEETIIASPSYYDVPPETKHRSRKTIRKLSI